jgi:hypothetical protein
MDRLLLYIQRECVPSLTQSCVSQLSTYTSLATAIPVRHAPFSSCTALDSLLLCGWRTFFMSVRHMSAKPFPCWTVAFVESSINCISGQATAVMSGVAWCVRGDDEALSWHMIADRNQDEGWKSGLSDVNGIL